MTCLGWGDDFVIVDSLVVEGVLVEEYSDVLLNLGL